ncbi:FAD-dependent monooxygenase [Nonomuraea jiangxiensis]|uniref:2-polyprenyl-6-methoxyphenol hydroxylase n=1 Tax=Nonomuraea jiangxiensis TaxID=633440 RepID=A0A1G8ZZ51_9ACTN|nr:FAD-dependent monooxygenase [Nonomuraea jiangxiensis]SDK19615.1 2-polyprenyl-6-methoxyphenol hydroxylase [Nonomuraea jiangxiensis]
MARAVVIGAGVGGLTAGVALLRAGWDVTVLERAPKIDPVGSGLAIAANALQALDTLDLGAEIRKLSQLHGQAGIRRPGGQWLVRTSGDDAEARFGDSFVVALRATLLDVLIDALGTQRIRLGTTVSAVDTEAGVAHIQTDLARTETGDPGATRADVGDAGRDHTEVSNAGADRAQARGAGPAPTQAEDVVADLIVAADGIHSATRQALFPEHPGPVYSGVTAWRGLVPARGDLTIRSTESWGRGQVFGVHPLAGGLVYIYATDVSPAGAVHGDERAELLRRFGDWHEPIPTLLRAADPAHIIRNDVHYFDTPLPAFHQGKVALLGDAAHPMTPNLGQGACQAIEDAIVLAHLVGPGTADAPDRLPDALAAYSAARLERTARIVKQSMTICKVTKLRNPVAVGLRDLAMRVATRLSPDLMLRSMDGLLRWHPPEKAAHPNRSAG